MLHIEQEQADTRRGKFMGEGAKQPTETEELEAWVNEPVTGPYPEFARKVRRLTGKVTRGVVFNRTGVSHDTIARAWRGERVGPRLIGKLAEGYGVPAGPLMEAAGYPIVVRGDGYENKAKTETPQAQPDDGALPGELMMQFMKLMDEAKTDAERIALARWLEAGQAYLLARRDSSTN